MNTVLDDNKILCLPSGERIGLSSDMRMIFEVEDVKSASPATVSRLGMVYVPVEPDSWELEIYTWLGGPDMEELPKEYKTYILHLIEQIIPLIIAQFKTMNQYMPVSTKTAINTFCTIYSHVMKKQKITSICDDFTTIKNFLARLLVFATVWGFGGSVCIDEQDKFDAISKEIFDDKLASLKLPNEGTLFDYHLDIGSGSFSKWSVFLDKLSKNPTTIMEMPLIPTADTIRVSFLLNILIEEQAPCLIVGPTGVGKSIQVKSALKDYEDNNGKEFQSFALQLTAQSECSMISKTIEKKMSKRSKGVFEGPDQKSVIFFVDDVNMPLPETSGAQPVIEILRQFMDYKGFYNVRRLLWSSITDLTIFAAAAPPGSGRSFMTERFTRHFNTLAIHEPETPALQHIFKTFLEAGFAVNKFSSSVMSFTKGIVSGNIELYQFVRSNLLPTPSKPLYTFNLRDLRKVFEGVLSADPTPLNTKESIMKLVLHENSRVYSDRLSTDSDREQFLDGFSAILSAHLDWVISAKGLKGLNGTLCFGDFMNAKSAKVYVEIPTVEDMHHQFRSYLLQYNSTNPASLDIVFFQDALLHLARILRILRQESGHGLLIGVGGTGKQTLVKLASFIYNMKIFSLKIKRGYDYHSYLEDLKLVCKQTGVQGVSTVFIISEQHLVQDRFLEVIGCLLNNGEVPNLFEGDEYENLLNECRPYVHAARGSESRDDIFQFFLKRMKENLRVMICLSPYSEKYRKRLKMNPALVNCCNINWFDQWPMKALQVVGKRHVESTFSAGNDVGQEEIDVDLIVNALVNSHLLLQKSCDEFMKETKRSCYVTPASFLDFLKTYVKLFKTKNGELGKNRQKLQKGLDKLKETNELVASMQVELTGLSPQLKKTAEDTEKLLQTLAVDQKKADDVKTIVSAEEAVVKTQTEQCESIAAEAQSDLDEALPALEAAMEALDALDKSDIAEIRVFNKPPEMVMVVMEAVCVLLGMKTDWASAKQLLGDPSFLKSLMHYDKDNIPEYVLKKLTKYTSNPNFTPEIVSKTSVACRSMCMWVLSLVMYSKCYKIVQPKRQKLKESQEALEGMRKTLEEKRKVLLEAEKEVEGLQTLYEKSLNQKTILEKNIVVTSQKLVRAEKLTLALSEEHERWTEAISDLDSRLEKLAGDMMISSIYITYLGPLTMAYRASTIDKVLMQMNDLAHSDTFKFSNNVGVPSIILGWNFKGLPKDAHSVENAIILDESSRWPLLIDPQEQVKNWILALESENNIQEMRISDKRCMMKLEDCIRTGTPVLLTGINGEIDPSLDPLIQRNFVFSGGRQSLQFGDQQVVFDPNFRFYMLTIESNPSFTPETCSRVTILNFMVTHEGLEDQLLNSVVKCERPELEEQKNQLIKSMAVDQELLNEIENTILKLLESSESSFLDDEVLINTLNKSKAKSSEIKTRVVESAKTEKGLNDARAIYLPVAKRGALIYFTLVSLEQLSYMYQYSMSYFEDVFNGCILNLEKESDLQNHLLHLIHNITWTFYQNVSKGLFEEHKKLFAFLLCCNIMLGDDLIQADEWDYFVKGGSGGLISNSNPKPAPLNWLSDQQWRALEDLEKKVPSFSEVTKTAATFSTTFKALASEDIVKVMKSRTNGPGFSDFQLLILGKLLNARSLTGLATQFVENNMSHEYVSNHPLNLRTVYFSSNHKHPLLFILSKGTDPADYLLDLAKEMNMSDKLTMISLGQGQCPIAEAAIRNAQMFGNWVFLQNCHLVPSWMSRLEEIVTSAKAGDHEKSSSVMKLKDTDPENTSSGDEASEDNTQEETSIALVHSDYRLWLSSFPGETLPKSVLQSSMKLTIEPPKGLKANVVNSFREISEKQFEDFGHIGWKKLVYSLCLFNAVIHERQKFGPVGWTNIYDFSSSDFHVARQMLQDVLAHSYNDVHWNALQYLTGDIIYGGKVTDTWDRRLLKSTLVLFYNENVLDEKYSYISASFGSKEGQENEQAALKEQKFREIYSIPKDQTYVSYLNHTHSFPSYDPPIIFGLDENASILHELKQTKDFLHSLGLAKGKGSIGTPYKNQEEFTFTTATEILEGLSLPINIEETHHKTLFQPLATLTKRRMSLAQHTKGSQKRLRRNSSGSLNPGSHQKKGSDGYEVVGLNCLSTFLKQEVQRFNNLLQVVKVSLHQLIRAMKGEIIMSAEIEEVSESLQVNRVPQLWTRNSYESMHNLGTWVADLRKRINFLNKWVSAGYPQSYWLTVFFFPQGFLTAVLQNYARQHGVAVNKLNFKVNVHDYYSEDVDKIPYNQDQTLVHGIFVEAADWSSEYRALCIPSSSDLFRPMPIISFTPKSSYEVPSLYYRCPLYKTSARVGQLSSTGHSTNFITEMCFKTIDSNPDFWIRRGVAMMCQI